MERSLTLLADAQTTEYPRTPAFTLPHRRRGACTINLPLPSLEDLSNCESVRRPGLPAYLDGFPDRVRQTELNSPLWLLRTLLLRQLDYHPGIRGVRERSKSCEYLIRRTVSRCEIKRGLSWR